MVLLRLGRSILRSVCHQNPNNSTSARLLFFRGFASTLFVQGICFSTTGETLAKSFSQFGEVLEAKIIMNKARNRSKGYGYVTFATEEEADRALRDMNEKVLDGRAIFVDKAWPPKGPRKSGSG